LPLIKPGIIAGAIFFFIISFDEFLLKIILNRYVTLLCSFAMWMSREGFTKISPACSLATFLCP